MPSRPSGSRGGRAPRRLSIVVLALAPAACGSSPGAPDAGDAALEPDTGAFVGPAPPVLLPCPPGWREVDAGAGAARCSPWPAAGRERCAAAEAHFPGEPGCREVGGPCPAGALPEDLPADRPAVFVLAGAPPGGDGTREAPHDALDSFAIGPLPAGTILALGAGAYDALVRLPAGLELCGACAARTVLRSAAAADAQGVVTPLGLGVALRHVSIADSARPGVAAPAGTSIEIDGVVVRGTVFAGVAALRGGRVDASDLVVRDVRYRPADGRGGLGLYADRGVIALRRGVLERVRSAGVGVMNEGAAATLEDLAITDMQSEADLLGGRGVNLEYGAQAELRRVAIERAREVALFGIDPGTRIVVEDTWVDDTLAREGDVRGGLALVVEDGALVEARRLVAGRSRTGGVLVIGAGAQLHLEDAVVHSTESHELERRGGVGISAQRGAAAQLTRVESANNRSVGVFTDEDGAVTAADLSIVGTRFPSCEAECPGLGGIGLGAYQRARAEVSRFEIRGSASCGVHVLFDASLDLSTGRVAGNPIGACVQVDGYDLARLTRDVAYVDNGVNLDARELPVPEPLPPIRPPR